MDVNIAALTTGHARLAFARNTQPLIERLLDKARAEGMTLSFPRLAARGGSSATLEAYYAEAGRAVMFRVEAYRRRDGDGVRLRAYVKGLYTRAASSVHESRGPADDKITQALGDLRSSCERLIAEESRRRNVEARLQAMGFEKLWAGHCYRDDRYAVEHIDGYLSIKVPFDQCDVLLSMFEYVA